MYNERAGITKGTVTMKGVVRGSIIELDASPNMPEGQMVTVVLRPALPPGESLRRSFGGWAEDGEKLDRFVEEVMRDRGVGRLELQF